MALTAAEQYMLELVNRARLDPAAEAARFGIDLNLGLSSGTLTSYSRQALAPNALLELAASRHSIWLLDNDVFSHTGVNGSQPTERVKDTGYDTLGAGENLAWQGTTGTMDLDAIISVQHKDLFLSAGHRQNMLTDSYREVGIAQEAGRFYTQGHDFNSSMVTQNFSKSGSDYFVTGVVYTDRNGDGFYSIGEGASGARFSGAGDTASSASAGGYALNTGSAAGVEVTITLSDRVMKVLVDTDEGNAKLDVAGGTKLFSSADITLVSGIRNVSLLGLDSLSAAGNGANNILVGNKGANFLNGKTGNDKLYGGSGGDKLVGGKGTDLLSGGDGSDTFVFGKFGGTDTISDYSTQDRLQIDNAIWGGTAKTVSELVSDYAQIVSGHVVLDFENGQTITIHGLSSLTTLAAEIQII